MTTTVKIRGIEQLNDKLDELEKRTSTKDLLDTAGAILLNRIKTRFLAQESPDGSKWRESDAARGRRLAKIDGGTLFDSGDLFHSISLGRSGTNGRSIFTTVDYADKHNSGLDGEEKRQFLGFNREDERAVTVLINSRIRGLL